MTSIGYKASFARLAFAGRFEVDPFPGMPADPAYIGAQLAAAAAQRPGVVRNETLSIVL